MRNEMKRGLEGDESGRLGGRGGSRGGRDGCHEYPPN